MRALRVLRSVRHAGGAMLGMMLAGNTIPTPAMASIVFTWDPAGASPALASASSAFTADTILGTHYLYADVPPTGPNAISFIEQINEFTLNGVPVATPGLNGTPGAPGSYGLYLTMQGEIAHGAPPGVYEFLNVALMADPGNNDGAVSSTLSGLAFAHSGPSGTADDITLATGSILSTTLSIDAVTGARLGTFLDSFLAAPGESGFFGATLLPTDMLYEVLTTPGSAVRIVPLPDGDNVTLLNGGSAVMDLQVPEPASMTLLGTGLYALVLARLRRSTRSRR